MASAVVAANSKQLTSSEGGLGPASLDESDLVAQLEGTCLSDPGSLPAACCAKRQLGEVWQPGLLPTPPPAQAQELTPEQDAAAQAAADAFVQAYEAAFLSRAMQQLDAVCAAAGLPRAAVAAKLRARGVDLDSLAARVAEVNRGISECESDEGWKLIQDGKLRLLYRHQPGSTVHSFKGSCELPAPMEQPLAMAREFDLVTSWNSYITDSPILRMFCDVDLLVYAAVWLPWPFAERDVLISAVADDQLRERRVVAVSFASPPQTPPDVELPAKANGRVRIFFAPGSCMTMQPVAGEPAVSVSSSSGRVTRDASSGERTRVCIVSNIDARLASVPEAIIQFVLRVFAPFMYSTVLGVLHKSFDRPDEPLPSRMAQHSGFYQLMRRRVDAFLAGHPE